MGTQQIGLSSGAVTRLCGCIVCLVLALLWADTAEAEPVPPARAEAVVKGWLLLDAEPLETMIGHGVGKVAAFDHPDGGTSYYVVYLEPSGFVIVAGDDLAGPVIAFSSGNRYDASEANPLGLLVGRDLAGRIAAARAQNAPGALKVQARWRALERLAHEPCEVGPRLRGKSSISQVHVAPLVKSTWSQTTVGGKACYNFYTPHEYPCGCVATAMAQLMRYHRYPKKGVGTNKFVIHVDGARKKRKLRGGDGDGGKYKWKKAVLNPDGSTKKVQRKAIGAVCHDAGVAVHMGYSASGSGATMMDARDAMRDTFGYSSAVLGDNWPQNVPKKQRSRMINAGAAAKRPVLLGIEGNAGGHAIVCDGYGYHSGNLYHHLNMGWAGTSDAWYKLPNVNSTPYSFTTVDQVVYNVFKRGSGEILSGRVTDKNGDAIKGAKVAAERDDGWSRTKKTNKRGIYAFKKLPSRTRYSLSARKKGHKFAPLNVKTGESENGSTTCGNRWNVDFQSSKSSLDLCKAPAGGRGLVLLAQDVLPGVGDAGRVPVWGRWNLIGKAMP